jgi:hypothetical protein
MGILSVFLIVDKMVQFYHISYGSIQVACDGHSALKAAFKHRLALDMDASDHDVISAIHHYRSKSPLDWQFVHIYGHQDRFNRIEDLPRVVQLNIAMDAAAKARLPDATHNPHQSPIPGEAWSLWLSEVKVTERMTSRLYDHVQRREAENYWGSKRNVEAEFGSLADWDAVGRAMASSSLARRTFVTKHTAGMCGVGKFMKRWGQRDSDACPQCDATEDSVYVWHCHGSGTDEVWAQ